MTRHEHRAGTVTVYGVHCGECHKQMGWTRDDGAALSSVRCNECMESELYDFHYADTKRGIIVKKTAKNWK